MDGDRDLTRGTGRALSPVVGGVLLVGIVVTLAGVTFFMVNGLSDETSPAPQAALDLHVADDGPAHVIEHRGATGSTAATVASSWRASPTRTPSRRGR